jgi:single-stranded-DNA-specific exonuclease
LNPAAVERLAETGHRLIVTVDCGVSDFEGISRARELGLDVIVTDHHQVPAVLPPALAVVNPQRKDHDFPQRDLAGVGVAFFFGGCFGKGFKN